MPELGKDHEPLGRESTVTTVVAKSEFTYDPATLAVDTEVISYNLDATAGYEFFRILDRSRDALGRDTGFILGSTPAPGVGGGAPASTIVEAQAAYAYSATDGRIAQISNSQIANQAFIYQYLPNSDLIEKVTGPIHTVINESLGSGYAFQQFPILAHHPASDLGNHQPRSPWLPAIRLHLPSRKPPSHDSSELARLDRNSRSDKSFRAQIQIKEKRQKGP